MANHKSAIKRIRANNARRITNRYQHKSTRTAIKNLKATQVKSEAQALLNNVIAMIDKLAKKNVIHKRKAANQKSKLMRYVNNLSA
jgi:small subunit ribosomal protein S20